MIQFKNLQVVGVRTKSSLLSSLIRFFTKDFINHTFNVFIVDGKTFAVEMISTGCYQTPIQDYIDGVKCGKYELQIMEANPNILPLDKMEVRESAWIKFNQDSIGKIPYNFKNLFIDQPIACITKNILGDEIWIGQTGEKGNKSEICQQFCYNSIENSWSDILKNDGSKANISDIREVYEQVGNIITKKDLI